MAVEAVIKSRVPLPDDVHYVVFIDLKVLEKNYNPKISIN